MSATARKFSGARRACAQVLQLVPTKYAVDSAMTAQCLRELANEADEGKLVGLAFVALRRDRSEDAVYAVGLADYCADRVVFWLHRLIITYLRN